MSYDGKFTGWRIAATVGEALAELHLSPPAPEESSSAAKELIVQVDGGHIPTLQKGKRSFEALSAIVYKPEGIHEIDKHHRQIVEKSCALSAVDDGQVSIKTYLLNAAHKQGLDEHTQVTALADGAANCWSAIGVLESHCNQLTCILDWFHIAMKFQTVKNALGEAFPESLDKAKWKLWHGKVEEALNRLELLKVNITDEDKRARVKGLYGYIKRNWAYIVNYRQRKENNLTFTSQVAESHVESVINTRHKKTGKMQWSREGAHQVLQIRASLVNQEWEKNWEEVVLSSLGAVA